MYDCYYYITPPHPQELYVYYLERYRDRLEHVAWLQWLVLTWEVSVKFAIVTLLKFQKEKHNQATTQFKAINRSSPSLFGIDLSLFNTRLHV